MLWLPSSRRRPEPGESARSGSSPGSTSAGGGAARPGSDRTEAVTSLEADFVQRRERAPGGAGGVAGTFAYRAPDLVRWDTSPRARCRWSSATTMLTWYKDLGKAERVKVGRASSQVLRYLNASGSLDSLMKYFTVTIAFLATSRTGSILPRYARIQKRLKGMTLWIARDSFLPVRVRYVEASGDLTEYRFEAMHRESRDPARASISRFCRVEIQEVSPI
ncbi:MAG: outer membrane lipoprotein carrier protein LolA [Thermoanaerobaculia bacterium]